MITISFDNLKITRRFKQGGFSDAQADALVETLQETAQATAGAVEASNSHRFTLYKSQNKHDFERLEERLTGLIKQTSLETKYEILKWVLPLILGLYGLIIFKIL